MCDNNTKLCSSNQKTLFNLNERINFINIMTKYMLSIKEKNNCLTLYNIDEKTKKPILKIGSKIILNKQIGLPSKHGIIYLAHFKKSNIFAVKITSQAINNRDEIIILHILTKFVIELKCPHFPISYGYLECNNEHSNNYNKIKSYFPELINKNNKYYIQINELANGDLYSLILKGHINLLNNIIQIFISIMFFHNYMNCYHYDSHIGNFLYHKIKPGGYFYYNIYGKDYYLENKGYLWVIWDFGVILPLIEGPKRNISINHDYKLFLERLVLMIKKVNRFKSNENNIILLLLKNIITKYDNIIDIKLLKIIDKEILEFLLKNVSSFTTIKPSNLLNKNPYIIK